MRIRIASLHTLEIHFRAASMTSLWLLSSLLLLFSSPAGPTQIAQTATKPSVTKQNSGVRPKAGFGTVTGRVFAITQDGDLKPARMVKVYLFCCTNREDKDGSSVALIYSQESLKARERSFVEQNKREVDDEDIACKSDLLMYRSAILPTIQQAQDSKKDNELLVTDSDEEGNFKFSRVPVGIYQVIASGRAGAYDAFWEDDMALVKVRAGSETVVKLSSPAKACPSTP